ANRPAELTDSLAHRRHPGADGAGRAPASLGRRGRLRRVLRRRHHRLLRRQDRPRAADGERLRADARPHRRQAAGRRGADAAGGHGTLVGRRAVPRHRGAAARNPGVRPARVPRRAPHRAARYLARQVEDGLPDGRARHPAGRRHGGGGAASGLPARVPHRRGHALGGGRAHPRHRLGLPHRGPAPRRRARRGRRAAPSPGGTRPRAAPPL
ncbi:MAG: CDP-diacylglycerol--glycerol-3-phosphate 3-phosphatidyltransferase, partial [uncultured Acetobacteraceae bacterium]